eukprot:4449781-Amphidinium_carterae.1
MQKEQHVGLFTDVGKAHGKENAGSPDQIKRVGFGGRDMSARMAQMKKHRFATCVSLKLAGEAAREPLGLWQRRFRCLRAAMGFIAVMRTNPETRG